MTEVPEYVQLGSAEKHVVEEVVAAIDTSIKNAEKLIAALKEIDATDLDKVMMDHKRKESIVIMAPALQALAKNLDNAQLTVILARIVCTVAKKDGQDD